MQKSNFIARLILDIKLDYYLAQIWAYLGMSDYKELKWLGKFVTSKDA